MLNNLGLKVAKLFGEGSHGLNPDYKPLREAPPLCGSLFEYLPYDTYDKESRLFFNRESTGFCLLGTPVAGATFNDQGKIDKFFTQAGNLPEGCSMQFLLVASPRIQDKLDYWRSYRTIPKFQGLTQKRYEFLKKKAFDKKTPIRDFKVIISYSRPGLMNTPVEKENLESIRETLQETLEKIGLFTKVMDDTDLLREVGNIINHEETTAQDECWYSEYEELAKLIPDSDIDAHMKKDGFYLRDGKFVAHSFLPKTSPKLWALGHMDKLFGDILKGTETIPCPFFMHYGFTICEGQSGKKKSALSKREMAEKACQNGLSKWQPGVHEEYEEASEVVKEIQNGERVIDACFSLTTICPPQDFKNVSSTVESIWNECGWSTKPATYLHRDVFLGSLPMMWSTGYRSSKSSLGLSKHVIGAGATFANRGLTRKTITKEPQNLLPAVAEWTGQVAPGIPLVGRRGQLSFWSPFDGNFIPGREMYKTGGNYNFCITGASGSGKSFLCNEIIENVLAVGGKAFVIDKGYSFEKICKSLGGKHVPFDFSGNTSINPFTHIPEEATTDEEIKDQIALLSGLQRIIRQMVFKDGEEEKAGYLNQAIQLVWQEKGSNGTIDAIAEKLRSNKDPRAHDIARCLLNFTSEGIYGSYFNSPANIDISSDFVVFETHGLEGPLKSVAVMMMMVQVWQRMISSDRKRPFLVLIDEAKQLLVGEESGNFISDLARTARKYRCSLGLATQSLLDFEESAPKAAWENSSWKVVMNQNNDTISGLGKHENLKEFVKDGYRETMLRSLGKADEFSELILFHDEVPFVPCRLYCDPYSSLLYSTSASDVSTLNDLEASGKSLDESIEIILQERERAA
ncbi:MAG: TraC family protein [Simkaniaceae bacterium]|nr:TraC family protein [Simkaniaceae bacterium]